MNVGWQLELISQPIRTLDLQWVSSHDGTKCYGSYVARDFESGRSDRHQSVEVARVLNFCHFV